MENQKIHESDVKSKDQRKKITTVAQGDFSLDNISFKPLTEGLGFNNHQVVPPKPKSLYRPPSHDSPRSAAVNPVHPHHFHNGLEAFYGNPPAQAQAQAQAQPLSQSQAQTKKVKDYPLLASKGKIIQAWLIDLALVCLMFFLMISLFYAVLKVELIDYSFFNFTESVILIEMMLIFVIYFLLYFSLCELMATSTLGKKVMSLKLINNNNNQWQQASFEQTLTRTFLVLLGLLGFGIPNYFNWQGNLSQTQIILIKNKKKS